MKKISKKKSSKKKTKTKSTTRPAPVKPRQKVTKKKPITKKKTAKKAAPAKKKTGKKVEIDRTIKAPVTAPEPIDDARLYLPQKLIAQCVGVSEVSVRKWPIKPTKKIGRTQLYYLPDVFAYRNEVARMGRAPGGDGESDEDFNLYVERSRLTHHQANIEAIKERQLNDELFAVDEVVLLGSALVTAARNRILSIHSKFATRYPEAEPEMIEEIEQLSIEALNELGSDGIPTTIRKRMDVARRRLESTTKTND